MKGYKQYPHQHLYKVLKLYEIPLAHLGSRLTTDVFLDK